MTKYLLDAVKTAIAIHNGDYSSLRGKYFVIRDKIKKKKDYHSGDNTVKKSRLDRIEESIAKLTEQMNARFDNLEKDINSLKQDVKDINARLDYIVSANNLKDSPKAKSK